MAYIDVDLDAFDTDELIEELEYRGYLVGDKIFSPTFNMLDVIAEIHQLRRTGQDYSGVLDKLIWESLGRVA